MHTTAKVMFAVEAVCVCVCVCVRVGSRQLPPRGEPGNTCLGWPKADSTAVNRVE